MNTDCLESLLSVTETFQFHATCESLSRLVPLHAATLRVIAVTRRALTYGSHVVKNPCTYFSWASFREEKKCLCCSLSQKKVQNLQISLLVDWGTPWTKPVPLPASFLSRVGFLLVLVSVHASLLSLVSSQTPPPFPPIWLLIPSLFLWVERSHHLTGQTSSLNSMPFLWMEPANKTLDDDLKCIINKKLTSSCNISYTYFKKKALVEELSDLLFE